MKKIYLIADIHTVSAFRLSGVEGVVSDRENALSRLEEIIGKADAGIVAITRELGEGIQERIAEINLAMPSPVVIEIPGLDDMRGFGRSGVNYIAEALGVSL